MQGFYRTPESGTLQRQVGIRGLALAICVRFAKELREFCRGFPGNLPEFYGGVSGFWQQKPTQPPVP
jgi:hypothetical protein